MSPPMACCLSATALSVDESILTGESLPVDKVAGSDEAARVYSGSLVVRGFGAAEVRATGVRSEIGRIGHALTTLTDETTPLFREVRRVVRWVALSAVLLCVAIAVIYAMSRTDWLGGVLAGITLAMGVLPEEFPVVLTVFLAMGAWRISRAGVLTRRMPAVESIGAATVLAVDKTGTLTENRMRVALIETDDHTVDMRNAAATLDDPAKAVLATALAASERDAFDPMERAIHEAARQWIPASADRLGEMNLIQGVRSHARAAGGHACLAATWIRTLRSDGEGCTGDSSRSVSTGRLIRAPACSSERRLTPTVDCGSWPSRAVRSRAHLCRIRRGTSSSN